ncbi:MAG: M42 family metallopeptidase [Firmicutes bacterium]|nr:M42 family metallopeptidase [Bacillota bacterium]
MLITELSQIPGVSGDESRVRDFIKEKLSSWGIEHYTDSLGNLFALKEGKKNGSESGLMLSAHMDEVGLLVSSVEKSGHLRFYKVGGVDERALITKPVLVGPNDVMGVIGAKAIHLQKKEERKKPLKIENLCIDIGAKDKDDAERVVKVGDYVSFYSEAGLSGNIVKGKALDNRAGCAALLEILQRDYPCSFTAVFTVQEEVGLRGAIVAAYRIKPRIALVLETTGAIDIPEAKNQDHSTSLGAGPAFTVKDQSIIAHPRVLERLIEVAERQKRTYQFRRYGGSSTDAGAISLAGSGTAAGVISTPCRYIHAPVSMLLKEDWQNLVEITDAFIRSVYEKGLEI